MKKTIFSFLAASCISSFVLSQTVDEGIKFIYYGRNKSAKETLQKVVAANPMNAYDIYWLGQALLADMQSDPKAVANTKMLYQKALTDGLNDPWIWVGMGHLQLLEPNPDINSAKQKFEQAITATKGKKGVENADILNAIGRANADGSSKQGDAQYGIDILKRAQAINLKNPDIDINLGMCYLKMGSEKGGEAVEAFRDAVTRNPQYAAGYYRMGRVYQGQNNAASFNEQYDKAIAADPAYAPVYLALYSYYEERDVNLAKENLDKYIANSDQDCNVDYLFANYLFRAGKYQESLNKAKQMEAGACRDFARVNVVYAYDYDRLGDSLQAKSYIEKFFATAPSSQIQPGDYVFAGKLLAKFPGSEDAAAAYLNKAIEQDSVKANKMEYMATIASIMATAKKYDMQLKTLLGIVAMKGKTGEADYYKICDAAKNAKNYLIQDSVARQYVSAFPDKPQGYGFWVSAAKALDLDTSKGLAVEPILKYNEFLMKDTAKNKKTIYINNYYLVLYYNDHALDLQKALDAANQMLMLYPAAGEENHDKAKEIADALTANLNRRSGQK